MTGFSTGLSNHLSRGVCGELLAESGAVEDGLCIVVDIGRSINASVFGMAQNKVDVLLFESGNEIILV